MAGPAARNDEPTSSDELNRELFAKGFAKLAETCETPIVIGLYGTWGVGKTSLMKLIKENLDIGKTRSVWFNPWLHQFDESPAVALVQAIVHELALSGTTKDTAIKIARAIGSGLLNKITGFSLGSLEAEEVEYEQHHFRLREEQARLQEYFTELIKKARGGDEARIVFFIDDLDRCMPQQCLRMLEALKLYLNIEGCVYFLGVDRDALQSSINHHYRELDLKEGKDYLDKIVQLPFTIPPIEPGSMENFIESLLPDELESCKKILATGLGDNPRDVKRFINTLSLNYQFDKTLDAKVLTVLLLIQYRAIGLYRIIERQKGLFPKLKEKTDETTAVYEEYLDGDEALRKVIQSMSILEDLDLDRYFYLTKAASIAEEVSPQARELNLQGILEKHLRWLLSGSKEGAKADLSGANLSGTNLSDANLSLADLSEANLSGANLSGASLRDANLQEANLSDANLSAANLRRTSLSGANLRDANLRGANLRDANLRGANLRDADLRRANLRDAELNGAELQEAKLQEADLQQAAISEEQLATTITDENTTLPDGSKGPFKPKP